MRNPSILRSRVPGAVFAAIAAALLSTQLRGQAVAAPGAQAGVLDLAGIRPGMTAQQAFDALKARAHGAQIGVGENSVTGVSEKPVPNSMAVFIPDTMPAQTITVWLTLPPSKQVVWAVGLEQKYPESGKMLPGTIVDALRKKYGPEVPPTVPAMALEPYWAFDEQGQPAKNAESCRYNQFSSLTVQPPVGATYSFASPLIYSPNPKSACDSLVNVRTQIATQYPGGYFSTITVIEIDYALVQSFREAYNAYIANASARQQQQELQKAKEQKAPVF
jgi:hypothetical protein